MPPCAFFRFRTKLEDECSAAEYEKKTDQTVEGSKKRLPRKK